MNVKHKIRYNNNYDKEVTFRFIFFTKGQNLLPYKIMWWAYLIT